MLSSGQIFITGTPRAGTTLIAQILGNHSVINSTYDSTNFMRFCYEQYGDLNNPENLSSLVHDLATRIAKRWEMKLDRFNVIQEVVNDDPLDITYKRVYNQVMHDLLLKNQEEEIWVEKTTMEWRNAFNFLKMFSKRGKVVHVLREPKAVLASWKKFTHAEGNDYLDIIFNCVDSRNYAVDNHEKFGNQYFPLLYDEFVQQPEDYLKRHCERNFLPVSYEEQMLDLSKCTDKSGNKWDGNSMFEGHFDSISTDALNKWRDELEDWEIKLTNAVYYNKEKDSIPDRAIEELKESDLAWTGFQKWRETGKGVERFPKDPTNPDNWESEEEQLEKWKEEESGD